MHADSILQALSIVFIFKACISVSRMEFYSKLRQMVLDLQSILRLQRFGLKLDLPPFLESQNGKKLKQI